MKPRQLLSIVAWQGLVIGLLGSLTGCAIALTFCLLQEQYHLIHLDGAIYFVDTLPVLISAWHYLGTGAQYTKLDCYLDPRNDRLANESRCCPSL